MSNFRIHLSLLIIFSLSSLAVVAEDGYRLWLRYDAITDATVLKNYRKQITSISVEGTSATMNAIREELNAGITGLLGISIPFRDGMISKGALLVGTPSSSRTIAGLNLQLDNLGPEGFVIKTQKVDGKNVILVAANTDIGALYGAFRLLKMMQVHDNLKKLNVTDTPKVTHRLLNHWDNLNGSIERGYAGNSLWEWDKLPGEISPRYKDYARANASIGINGSVLTNVNANAQVLTPEYLVKVAAIAGEFRPYGIKVYLTARFSAPVEIGGLDTADPLNDAVRTWWKNKIDEIYRIIPDFGGILVKANSEGQPGPQNYNRTHADGANMMAEALAPHGGVVMWRAFVYDNNVPRDRALQAYDEFKPLDGKFLSNVFVQVKNGAIDFQPREPFHPLFGAMPETPLMMEFQITQEYLGQETDLAYMAPLYEETLKSDTYAKGPGSTVDKVIDGSLENHSISGMAGVANTGNDRNWTHHPFHQANWYAYGRLAWDPYVTSAAIADDWIRMTFTHDKEAVAKIKSMMMASREIVVNYMTPLGLHHIMARSHHYGPGPWVTGGRADWTSVYYHRADSAGVGFDRTRSGSGAVDQYFGPVADKFNNLETVPEEFLLWFHHVPWDYKTSSGRTLWNELVHRYNQGVDSVRWMQETWASLQSKIDAERFNQVKELLEAQEAMAVTWRDACLLYFQQFSGMPIPDQYEKPARTLEEYMRPIRGRR